MTKTYELPNGRIMTADFDENGIGKITVQALDSLVNELNEYAEHKPRLWNNHQVACLLADMFGDSCACNYNGIDEWLPNLCDFKDTCCPNPVGVACWEQFLEHSRARYCECGYEVR